MENLTTSTIMAPTIISPTIVAPAITATVTNGALEEATKKPLKRPYPDLQEDPKLPAKKGNMDCDIPLDVIRSDLQKSPVALLNKLRRPLQYCVISQAGPAHSTCFTVSVLVDGKQYVGSGPSKRLARAAAALKALAVILQPEAFPDNMLHDFTSDEHVSSCENSHNNCETTIPSQTADAIPVTETPAHNGTQETTESPVINKSPINLVYEKFPDVTFDCQPIESDSCLKFKVTCNINGQKYDGFGSSKRSAKLGAAKVTLAALGINLPIKTIPKEISTLEMPDVPSLLPLPAPPGPSQISSSLHQTLADRIAKTVLDKFNNLMHADPVHVRRKVLAGIVMTSGTNYEHMEVIAVSTGTKCVSGERLSTCGLAVNDCHAEVISRRCFQEYIYDCLKDIADSPDGRGRNENPLELAPDGGYQLRGSYRFHLYISTAPCGDARIFSPHEETCRPPDRHPNRQARGQLRTKIESGEGTIPVKSSDGIQTWDGVLQGERLLTMSCSDKVARWNVLGLQGALLSVFVRPIYLESIVLGSLLHPHHLYRAVCGRLIGTLKGLPPPFRLNRPMLVQCSSSEQRQAMRAPSFSVNWTVGRPAAEVVNAMTGKTDSGLPSKLCKQNMFKKWTCLASRLSPTPQVNWANYTNINCVATIPKNINFSLTDIQYDIAKSKAALYQNSKLALYNAFLKANLGKWLKKPIEQDQFEIFDTGNCIPKTNTS